MTVLIVSPHSDDAELGCGGFIHRMVQQGQEVHVATLVVKPERKACNGLTTSCDDRLAEQISSLSLLGVPPENLHLYYFGGDLEFDLCTEPKSQVVGFIDKLMRDHAVSTLMLPVPSFHQEHVYAYEVGLAAARPTKGKTPLTKVLAYEYPAYSWGNSGGFSPMHGGSYFCLNEEDIALKIEALKGHKSQFNLGKNDLISVDGVRALARLRGLEAATDYAELFYVLKEVHRNGL